MSPGSDFVLDVRNLDLLRRCGEVVWKIGQNMESHAKMSGFFIGPCIKNVNQDENVQFWLSD